MAEDSKKQGAHRKRNKPHPTLTPKATRGLVLLFPLLLLLGHSPVLLLLFWKDSQPAFLCSLDHFSLQGAVRGAHTAAEESFGPQRGHILPPETVSLRKKDLNSATAAELTTINYVGKVLSQRIVDYRERLGGFFHLDQLNEVERAQQARRAERKKVVRCTQALLLPKNSHQSGRRDTAAEAPLFEQKQRRPLGRLS